MERRYQYYLVDVFTKTRLEGNPLAVFPFPQGLSDLEMQRIAGELNLSETVFLSDAAVPAAAAKARIFTPRRELDFAGHPTIGAAYVLALRWAPAGRFAIEENVGLVPIERDNDETGNQRFWLTTPKLTFFETLDATLCARLLNLSDDDIAADAPPQFVSAGSPVLIICLKTTAAVDRAALQQQYLGDALGSAGSVGTFIFARKEPASATCFDVYSRMFAPQTGVPEDPATGGATGPLAGYMLENGMLPRRDGLQFSSEQGRKMGRLSFLHVRLGVRSDQTTIEVGGTVVLTGEATLFLD
jgi:trans-2,3-dihydro-3-hydroxyanthranilate isomerase